MVRMNIGNSPDLCLAKRLAALGILLGSALPLCAQTSTIVTLTGQSMIRSDLRTAAPEAVARIQPLLAGDVVFTNLEGAVAQSGQSVHEGRGFLTPPEALDALRALGFNLLALSDNHAFDLQATGINNTLAEADRRGFVHAGTGHDLQQAAAPAYLHSHGLTVGFVASASGLIAPGARAAASQAGVNELRIRAGDQLNEATEDLPDASRNTPDPEDVQRILQSIREARAHADLVIVYQHNHVFGSKAFVTLFSEGMAERLEPNEWLRTWTHAEVDAGADIVVMHGAPLLHGLEIYRGRPIFYDLGNFIYNVPPTLTYIDEPMAWESAVARLEYKGKSLQSITLHPLSLNPIGDGQPDVHDPYVNNEFLRTRGLPSAATGAKARYILERLSQLSQPFGTRITVQGDVGRVEVTELPKQ
jgi:poly-gamma-glutamate capsule biosynthesis protein CapA/YwtB (metallophosphatase superfamily)